MQLGISAPEGEGGGFRGGGRSLEMSGGSTELQLEAWPPPSPHQVEGEPVHKQRLRSGHGHR